MRGLFLSLSAITVGVANAWTYPDCEPDNCYRNLMDARFYGTETGPFCLSFLSGTHDASAIPTDYANCGGDVTAVSSACSCITYSLSTTSTAPASSATSAPVTTAPSSVYVSTTAATTAPSSVYSSAQASTSSAESSTAYTTSTIYATTTYAVTSCAPTVTDCPATTKPETITQTYVVSTTVCPVSSKAPAPVTSIIYSTSSYVSSGVPCTTTYPVSTTVIYPASSAAGIVAPTTLAPVTKTYAAGTGNAGVSATMSSGLVQVSGNAAVRGGSVLEVVVAAAGMVALAVL